MFNLNYFDIQILLRESDNKNKKMQSRVSQGNFSIRSMKPVNMKKTEEAMKGHVFTGPETYRKFVAENGGKEPVYVIINGTVYTLSQASHYSDQEIGLHKYARQALRISLTDELEIQLFKIPQTQEYRLAQLEIELDILQMATQITGKLEIDDEEFSQKIHKIFTTQFFKIQQMIILDYQGNILVGKIIRTSLMQLGIEAKTPQISTFEYGGMMVDETAVDFALKPGQLLLKLKSTGQKTRSLFAEDFSFDQMGVGGLDQELANIFRRAFASRRFPPAFLEQYGIQHVKGMLLYGPPGTGKTLIARQLATVLKAKEPKIVNGPEIFSKYVGEAEENVRKLFKEAIEDQQALGDESPLHIIVLDEMDAICKQRGTINSGAGAYDNVVNQLLSMIDGVNSLSNILVIGMTNRKDLIDEAVLRPGRLEVHIEVGLPDEKGRQQILAIHTEKLRKSNALDSTVDLAWLAAQMKNYTGAEIQATVKSASSFAFQRINSVFDFNKKVQTNKDEFKVTIKDFENALLEVKPMFGMDTNKFDVFLRNQLVDFGPSYQKIQTILKNAIEQTRNGKNSQLNSILLEGEVGCGKTSIAAWAAIQCGFPYVKLISPENFVGYTEGAIINQIMRVFNDAYKSPYSCIVIDNIERLIEYVDIGPRFSNNILQALLVLIKKLPEKEQNRLLIIGTTSQARILKDLEVLMCFNLTVKVHNLTQPDEIKAVLSTYSKNSAVNTNIARSVTNIPIKRFLMILDMATHGEDTLEFDHFMQCYESVQMSAY